MTRFIQRLILGAFAASVVGIVGVQIADTPEVDAGRRGGLVYQTENGEVVIPPSRPSSRR